MTPSPGGSEARTPTAERLREAMAEAIRQPYPPTIFRKPSDEAMDAAHEALRAHGSTLDGLSAYTIRECVGPWAMERALAALVRETGLNWEMVEAMRDARDFGRVKVPEYAPIIDAFIAILEAAGVPRKAETE